MSLLPFFRVPFPSSNKPSHTNRLSSSIKFRTPLEPQHSCFRSASSMMMYRSIPTLRRIHRSSDLLFFSSCEVIQPSRVPSLALRISKRLRRLKSLIAITTASRLVLTPVNRIASANSSDGISIVVLMLPF